MNALLAHPSSGPIEVQFERTHQEGRVPTRATEGSAAYDVYSLEHVVLQRDRPEKLRTGIKVQPPPGWCVLVFPRSGMGLNGTTFPHSIGVIDSDYGGELLVLLVYRGSNVRGECEINAGDRIAQIMMVPAWPIRFNEVTGTIQGRGGFGSTGR